MSAASATASGIVVPAATAWNQLQLTSQIWIDRVPEPIRFMTAAGLGNIAFFHIDRAFYESIIVPLTKDTHRLFQKNKETISFFFSYLIQVGFQHFLNAALVYGLDTISTAEKYIETLILTYSSYSLSLIGSTIGNAVLIGHGVPKNVAFWGTIFTFGVVNFFLLRLLMSGFSEQGQEDKSVPSSSSSSSSSSRGKKNTRNPKNKSSVVSGRFRGGSQSMFQCDDLLVGQMIRHHDDYHDWLSQGGRAKEREWLLEMVTSLGPKVCYNLKEC